MFFIQTDLNAKRKLYSKRHQITKFQYLSKIRLTNMIFIIQVHNTREKV